VGASEAGGQALSLGLINHMAIDIVPVVFGREKRRRAPATQAYDRS
jgi:hypothetical protein